MIGNVWESTTDWYRRSHVAEASKSCRGPRNPRGTSIGDSVDPRQPGSLIPRKMLEGGSHLCSENCCHRVRPVARFPDPVDTSTSHVGFGCIHRALR
jgi:formylglycine-generating enzyme